MGDYSRATCAQCGWLVLWLDGYEPEDKWCEACHEPLTLLAPKVVFMPKKLREE
jgi:NAD-dependent SIR2 family protein deacetylase